ncbi:MAG: hypothetical protein JSW00_14975 [Thermoplasmata archaeon]|nr:MAG: hypothetical protein JSW00_14975 [Thermoplasmata archaeon]
MKRFVIIFGIVLAVTIFMSGSSVAPWIVSTTGSMYCTNANEAIGAPDGVHATAGQNNPKRLGMLRLAFDEGDGIPPSTTFTVYASSTINESYGIQIESANLTEAVLGNGWDTENLTFETPSDPGEVWQYVYITGATGQTGFGDSIYGPEVDAVGW